ncbi:MAG: hypothetical protein QOF70_2810 [Acetobacteraceae bacterium]|jgi:SapC|nr:SapC family protein [Rhodopila sp.]MEA2728335.1 hypothetical protein [Acetobacteraceae bacterium]
MSESSQSPLFYNRVRMLDRAADRELRLMPPHDFRFASETNAIPLVAEELFSAQASYPIVFADAEAPKPIAVVGLRNHENLFVRPDGSWEPNAYLPLYVRRHPFLLIDDNDGRLHLGIDDAAPCWSMAEGMNLFDMDEPTVLTKNMLEFCTRYRRQHRIALALGMALKEQSLLVEYRFNVTVMGEAHNVSGCMVVAEDRLAALPDEVFLEWRAAGWLPMITAHLLSLRQWESLGRMSMTHAEPAALAA